MKNNDIAMGITYMATNLQAYGESLEVLKHGVGGPLNDERLRERMIEEKKKMSITWKEFRVLAYNLSNNISFSNELLSQQYDENEEITFPNNGKDLIITSELINTFSGREETIRNAFGELRIKLTAQDSGANDPIKLDETKSA